MSRCQTCRHSRPIFVTSDIRIDGFEQVCCDCKTKVKDGYAPIDNASIVAERQQGEWIIVKDEKWGDNVKCPFCGKELAGTDLNFCCKCGAKLTGSEKMNGGKEE